jgi:predicted RNA-binding protein with PUA-like domain
MMVDVRFKEKFAEVVPLDVLKETPGLEEMYVIRKGMRLSIQPVTKEEFQIVRRIGRATGRTKPNKKTAKSKSRRKR